MRKRGQGGNCESMPRYAIYKKVFFQSLAEKAAQGSAVISCGGPPPNVSENVPLLSSALWMPRVHAHEKILYIDPKMHYTLATRFLPSHSCGRRTDNAASISNHRRRKFCEGTQGETPILKRLTHDSGPTLEKHHDDGTP